jgi:hypothetical protein
MEELDKLLKINWNNAPPPLELCIPLDQVLDIGWSRDVSNSILTGKTWVKTPVTSLLRGFLPEKAGLYMFVWKCPFPVPNNDDPNYKFSYVLYVGKAGSTDSGGTIKSRFANEYENIIGKYPESLWIRNCETRKDRLKRILNLRELEFWYIELSKLDEIEYHESTLIRIFNPPGNSQFKKSASNLSGKIEKAISAF